MGRTQATYRMRLQKIRNRLTRFLRTDWKKRYKELWTVAHSLSAPSSALPYPDTHAVASFSMMLEIIARVEELHDKIEKRYSSSSNSISFET